MKLRVLSWTIHVLLDLSPTPDMLWLGLGISNLTLHLLLILLISLTYLHVLILSFKCPVNGCLLLKIEESVCVSAKASHLIPNVFMMLSDLYPKPVTNLFGLFLYYLTNVLSLRILSIFSHFLLLLLLFLLKYVDFQITWFLVMLH